MPIDYVAEIKTKVTSDLIQMLDSLEANQKVPQWPPGKAFEHIVLRAFEIERTARVVWPFTVPLHGIENQVMCRGLMTKSMYAVEWGMPDYDIRKELR
jgi:hypothetical protein